MRSCIATGFLLIACVVLASCNVRDPRLDEPIPDGLDTTSDLDAESDTSDETVEPSCSQCNAPPNAKVAGCPDDDCEYECEAGYVDKNRDLPSGLSGDGCEETCEETNGGRETCDDLDNDCDGQVDEGLARTCGSTNDGPCAYGEEVCRNGEWSECEGAIEPEEEVCDDIDNDCDGRVDENLTQTCGTNIGNCQEGQQECRDGVWGPCNGDVEPRAETCNSSDDDCDGEIDEGVKAEWFEDRDGDDYGTNPILACAPSGSHTAFVGGDCDDTDPDINPDALETCWNASEDRDCDGKPACDDPDCDGRECDYDGAIGTCENGTCVPQ
ncbi:MAG: MopE-related protein [Myxococcota bacterium]